MFFGIIQAQSTSSYELGVGIRLQKTQKLYWENGVGCDFTSDFLMKKKVHLKLSYASSRLGTAFKSNALKQDNYLIGVDWRFMSTKDFQIFAGLNTGFFHVDTEYEIFDMLPSNSVMLSVETGIYYKFKFPIAASLSIGYNVITGDGINSPGTLFPVFYQMSVYYLLKK
jgi:hypothetical protein